MRYFSPKVLLKVSIGLMMVMIATSLDSRSASAAFLTNESPTNGNFSYEGSGSGYSNPNDMAKHILIASNHGDVPNIRLGMYFNTGDQKTVRIVNPGLEDGGLCGVNGSPSRPLSGDFVRVRIWDPNNASNEVIYNIRGTDVCNNQAATNLPNTPNPKFFGTYKTPQSTIDSQTGKYRLNIVISLIDINSLPDDSGNDQVVSFKLIGPAQSLIGNIDTNQSSQASPNNSTIAKRVGNAGGVTHRFGFALACSETEKSPQKVTLYDPDNGFQAGGDVKFYIATVRNNGTESPLDIGEYGARGNASRSDIGSVVAFKPDDGEALNAFITIKNMDPTLKYVLVIKNVHSGGRPSLPTTSNFIYVGMPGDSIYGAENFECPGWKATPNTTINRASVTAGTIVSWTHTVKSTGDKTTAPINWQVKQEGAPADPGGTPSDTIGANKNAGEILNRVTKYKTKSSDVGKNICQYIQIRPRALRNGVLYNLNNAWELSEQRCVRVVAPGTGNFDPTVEVWPEVVEPNEEYTEESRVTPGTIPYASELGAKNKVQYWLARLIYQPNTPVFSQTTSTDDPTCEFYGTPACELQFKSGEVSETGGVSPDDTRFSETFPDNLPPGTNICYTMAVEQPPTVETHTYQLYLPTGELDEDGNPIYQWYTFTDRYYSDVGHNHEGTVIPAVPRDWKYDTACVMVGKRPKVQILGNDLRVRGESQTKVTRNTGNYYGSWVEYGVFSTGIDNAPASGAGYRNGNSADLDSRLAWSRLTFANTNENLPGAYGYYASIPASPALAAYYNQQTEGSSPPAGSLTEGMYRTGSVEIGASENLTKTTILYSTGTVTISGNISYKNEDYTSLNDIPQVIIVAENINIKSNVSNIDAWLIAYGDKSDPGKGNINTCSDGPPTFQRTSAACNVQLVVNGPVVANGLYLNRTGPTSSSPSAPAETFRLRPDTYFWAASRQRSTGAARTVDIVELPPRF